jgi:putative membrane protein
MLEITLRYTHFICVFCIVACVATEFFLLKRSLIRAEVSRIAAIDAVYGIAAMVLIIAGLTLALGNIGKPAIFYRNNPIFYTKLGLFLMVGLISIRPTIFFIKQRKGDPNESIIIPTHISKALLIELIILAIIPFFAGLMSHGIGLKI